MMKLRALLALALATMSAIPAAGQLSAPSGAGVAMGHLHLYVRDVDANRRFLIVLGGRAVESHGMHLIQFHGVDVLLDKGEPTGGTVGTAVNHIGFQVRSMEESLERWRGAGLKIEPGNRPSQVYLTMPDEIRVEILEDPALKTPLAFHHVHFYVSDIAAMQAWYAKNLGAIPGKRGQFDAADVPGVNLTFQKADTAQTPTKGAALDHIGFEVNNLEAFTKRLTAAGVKLDRPYRKSAESNVASAWLTDPSGTTIELTEGLAAAN